MATGLLAGTLLLVSVGGLGVTLVPMASCPNCPHPVLPPNSCKRCKNTSRITLLNQWLGHRRPVPGECRLVEEVYQDGWKVCAKISVFSDGRYSTSQINVWSQPPATKVFQGSLPDSISRTVLEAGRDDSRFTEESGIPTYTFGADNFRQAHPKGIDELILYVRSQTKEAK
jgi:hypothetical protein